MDNLVIYELCLGTSVIGPDFKNRHIPNEAETTLNKKVAKNLGSADGANVACLPSNPTTPQFRSIHCDALPKAP